MPIFLYFVTYQDPWKRSFTEKFNTKTKRDEFVKGLIEKKLYFSTHELRTSLTLIVMNG